MAATVHYFTGFESATKNMEEGAISGSIIFPATSPAPPDDNRSTAYCKMIPKAQVASPLVTDSATDWFTIGVIFQFTDFDFASGARGFIDILTATQQVLSIYIEPDSSSLIFRLRVKDANGTNLALQNYPDFSEDAWYRLLIKFQHKASGDFYMWMVNAESDHNVAAPDVTLTGKDFLDDQTNIKLLIKAHPTVGNAERLYVDGYYISRDSGTNYDTNDDSLLRLFGEVGAFLDDTKTTGTPYFGHTLNGGSWANTQEVPASDSNVGSYTISRAARNGGISTVSASVPTNKKVGDGLKDESLVQDGRLVAGKWVWRIKYNTVGDPFFGEAGSLQLKYGDATTGIVGTDNTVTKTILVSGVSTSYTVYTVVSILANDMPSKTEYFQIGFGATLGDITFTVTCAEMFCFILREFPKPGGWEKVMKRPEPVRRVIGY